MKIVGLMPCRNEAWCIGLTARAALMWINVLVVLDHASTDDSAAILRQVSGESRRLVVLREAAIKWDEMRHRQKMLDMARKLEATHIVMIDADELLTGNLISTARELIAQCSTADQHGQVLELPGYNLRNGIYSYHANGLWGRRLFSVAFDDTARLAHWSGDTFHHRVPHGIYWLSHTPVNQGQGGILHLWGASERRLRAKHALYKITERLRWPQKSAASIDAEYSAWRSPADAARAHPASDSAQAQWTYATTPEEWWTPYSSLLLDLQLNREPWQEAECRRLIAEYGAEMFADLDLFGVTEPSQPLAE